jgi:hypothetical protein
LKIYSPSAYSVEYPEDNVTILESSEHIHVEADGNVSTQ